MEIVDLSAIIVPRDERNWTERYFEGPECKTKLICPCCKEFYLGWKLREKCRVCAYPKLPIDGRVHITGVADVIEGKIYALPAPCRHPDIFRAWRIYHNKNSSSGLISKQGFITNTSIFLNRRIARALAIANNLCISIPDLHPVDLFSEDMW